MNLVGKHCRIQGLLLSCEGGTALSEAAQDSSIAGYLHIRVHIFNRQGNEKALEATGGQSCFLSLLFRVAGYQVSSYLVQQ